MANDYITKAYLDLRFDEFEEKMDGKFTQLKSDIFDKLDEKAGTQTRNEEENAAHEMSHERVSDNLDNLDKRVTVLEKGN
ncbi:MAG: hypothetical protein G01um10145_590 [Microgenomates group bacterium Gr01-1014_5]|nr:MAG: hypothetical protein G01um10145_590 [Microgenomates group bacterium Gr01-1014_5]